LSDMELSEETNAILIADGNDPDIKRLFGEEMAVLETRQLFVTKAGRFGYAKRGVQPGDVVVVFNGAPIPHVLRRAQPEGDSQERWRFVNDAYVHDLMHFEADGIAVEVEDFVVI